MRLHTRIAFLNKVWESVFKKALVALFNRINAEGVLVFTYVFGQL